MAGGCKLEFNKPVPTIPAGFQDTNTQDTQDTNTQNNAGMTISMIPFT